MNGETTMNATETIYYVYGYSKHTRNISKDKPIEMASVEGMEEMLDAVRQAKELGYREVFARTKPLPWGQYRLAR
jgi:hypothetical protein